MSDRNNFFKGYNLNDVHDWYMDLAKRISDLSGIQSTAPKLLEYYLSPNNQKRNKKIIDFCKIVCIFGNDVVYYHGIMKIYLKNTKSGT